MGNLIGICGKSEHGKDTCAQLLQKICLEKYNIFAEIRSLGYFLREFVSCLTQIPIEKTLTHEQKANPPEKILFPLNPEETILNFYRKYNYTPPESAKTPSEIWSLFTEFLKEERTVREILQFVGTDLMRNHVDPKIWFQVLENDWISKGRPLTIIPDCRYPNERDFILDKNGFTFRILRPGHLSEKCNPNHPSEISLDNVEMLTIINPMDETLENLLEEKLKDFFIRIPEEKVVV